MNGVSLGLDKTWCLSQSINREHLDQGTLAVCGSLDISHISNMSILED